MGIRMSSNQFTYNYMISLNQAYQRQTKLFEQADGASIHRGSDDAIAYTKLLRRKISLAENSQYQSNAKEALSWMKTSDGSIAHMAEIMKTFTEKSVNASNDNNEDADFTSISKEMMAEIQEIVATGNTQEGDRYVFSGQKDTTQPFNWSEKADRGLAKTLDNSQIGFFTGSKANANAHLVQMLTLHDDKGDIFYLDTKAASDGSYYIYSKEFMDEGYKDAIEKGDTSIKGKEATYAAGKLTDYEVGTTDFTVSAYFDKYGVLNSSNANPTQINTTALNGSSLSSSLDFSTVIQPIVTYSGDHRHISMVKLNGAADPSSDSVNLTGQQLFGSDIFDNEDSGNQEFDSPSGSAMINQMLTVYTQTAAQNSKWMSSDGITVSNVAHSTITIAETSLGARAQLYDSVSTMLTNQEANITEEVTNISSTDVAKLAVKLMEMSTLYNMSLSMGGRILPQSLADYL